MKNIFIAAIISAAYLSHAQVTTWEGPKEFVSTKYYKVKVNGIPVSVYDTPIASYTTFDFKGEVVVQVVSPYFDIRWVDVRPSRHGIKVNYVNDSTFTFKMSTPMHLSLELNQRIRQQPLYIFTNAPETSKPSKTDTNVIYFESGKIYPKVSMKVKSNKQVYIEGGAVVQGNIYADTASNIKISGRGIMDGSLLKEYNPPKRRFVDFRKCDNIVIQDIILHNSMTWTLAAFYSNNVTIKNTKLVSENPSDDGIDIFRCTNVTVDGVFAHTKDDCVAVKSGGKNPDAPNTDNILVKNCTFWNSVWGNAIEIGFELFSKEVKNIRFENIDIIHVEDGAAISIHNAGQSHVHDVVFDNIRIEDCRQKLFDIAIFLSQYSPDGYRDTKIADSLYMRGAWDGVQRIPLTKQSYHNDYRGKVSNITFKNIQITEGGLPFSVFYGHSEVKNIENITFENITYLGKKLTNAQEMKLVTKFTKNIIYK
ncbi:MAG: glycosyl hydrolase family 28 protein [Cytophagales bacterium]|nr:glycosyl hydrolase family 28 protein [Cytophagales bacterium]